MHLLSCLLSFFPSNSRGYDIVLPLLAAAGTGPTVVQFYNAWERKRRVALLAGGEAGSEAGGDVGGEEEARAAARLAEQECDIDNRVVCEPLKRLGDTVARPGGEKTSIK